MNDTVKRAKNIYSYILSTCADTVLLKTEFSGACINGPMHCPTIVSTPRLVFERIFPGNETLPLHSKLQRDERMKRKSDENS